MDAKNMIEALRATRVSQAAVDRMEGVLETRVSRTHLDPTKHYVKVQQGVRTYMGRFVRAYRMGSGDGMTAHWEFDDRGQRRTVDDEMWGSVSGTELAYFVESDPQMRPPTPPMPALEPQVVPQVVPQGGSGWRGIVEDTNLQPAAPAAPAPQVVVTQPIISVILPPIEVPKPAPGDFTWYDQDAHAAYCLHDAWAAVTVNEAWPEMAKGPEDPNKGYMWSTPSPLRQKVNDSLKYKGYSGASYGMIMRIMQSLGSKGDWQRWVGFALHERAAAKADDEATQAEKDAYRFYALGLPKEGFAAASKAVIARMVADKRRAEAAAF